MDGRRSSGSRSEVVVLVVVGSFVVSVVVLSVHSFGAKSENRGTFTLFKFKSFYFPENFRFQFRSSLTSGFLVLCFFSGAQWVPPHDAAGAR